jgi:uncharacterized membrane protein YczE
VLLLGWLMGGAVGFGTVIIALSLGPSIQFWFRLLRVPYVRQARSTTSSSSDELAQNRLYRIKYKIRG